MDQPVRTGNRGTESARDLAETLRRDGFVFFRDFLPVADIEQAAREIETLYARDLEERRAAGVTEPHHDGGAGHSILTKPTHLLLDLYGKSPALDRLFERILTD